MEQQVKNWMDVLESDADARAYLEEDPLGAARGVIYGLGFALPVWAAVIAAAWWLL